MSCSNEPGFNESTPKVSTPEASTPADRRQFLLAGAQGLAWALVAGSTRSAVASEQTAVASAATGSGEDDGRHDFDFFHGHWQVANERLQQRHVGSSAWDRFDARIVCRPLLQGVGVIDEYFADFNGGIVGFSLRLFNLETRRWADYWASRRDGVLGEPLIGGFANGIGEFLGREMDNGVAVTSRYRWSGFDGRGSAVTRFVWEQAFSTDAGRTWETNWIMRMTRVAA